MEKDIRKEFEKLEAAKSKIIQLGLEFPIENWTKKIHDDSWTAIETLGHILEVEKGVMSYMRRKLDDPSLIKGQVGFKENWNGLLLWWALKSPFKFKAPSVLKPSNPDAPLELLFGEWDTLRIEYKDRLDKFPRDLKSAKIFKHPVVGDLNIFATLKFMTQHIERHHSQVVNALKS